MNRSNDRNEYENGVLESSPYDTAVTYDDSGAQQGVNGQGVNGQGVNGKVQAVPIAAFGDISKSRAVMAPPGLKAQTLTRMLDVPISLVFEVGRTKITIAHLMELREGSYINLRNVAVDVIDVRVNDNIIAQAEAISLQTRYGMRISSLEKMPGSEEGNNDV